MLEVRDMKVARSLVARFPTNGAGISLAIASEIAHELFSGSSRTLSSVGARARVGLSFALASGVHI